MAANRPSESRKERRYPLYVHITTLFSALVLACGIALGWLGYVQSRDIAFESAERSFRRIGASVHESLRGTFQPIHGLTRLLAVQAVVRASTLEQRLEAMSPFAAAIHQNPVVAAAYVGYPDGGFFLVRPLADDAARAFFHAPPEAAYLVHSVDFPAGAGRRETYLFFDRSLAELDRQRPEHYGYDPRGRPWYSLARRSDELVLTDPYAFFSTASPGVTFALRTADGSVVGVDVTLRRVSDTLAALRTSPAMHIALFDAERRVLAYSDPQRAIVSERAGALALARLPDLGEPVLAALLPAQPEPAPASSPLVTAGGRDWKATVLPTQSLRGSLSLGIALPLDDLLGDARRIRDRGFLATLAVLVLALPITWWIARRIGNALRDVTERANEIQQFRFGGAPAAHSAVLEVDQLAGAINLARDTIRRFLDIATSLIAERRFDSLLERLVRETASATGSSGGVVFLADDDGKRLAPASAIALGQDEAGGLAPVEASGDSLVARAYRTGAIQTAAANDGNAPADIAGLTRLTPNETGTLTAIPLRDREGETTGVLVLPSGAESGLSAERIAFAEALSGTAAIAIENQRLLAARKALLDAFIRLVAGAIDAKSPYTGGHCARVPELTAMLARAACETREGPLRDFVLDEEGWEAVHIASWLHDCGKVTTPEYVVDKATKLETLYDRIHEIRMRFEVLKRDAEIDYWKQIAAGGDPGALRETLEAARRTLDEEFSFVARCNRGGEAMDPADIARLADIARREWRRTLDDRIGISHEEKMRKDRVPAPELPVIERLLADRPDHIVGRAEGDRVPDDNPWGFRMDVPRFKYNRGELYNLSVGRGTLTEEDRYVINHHIVQSIVMLSQLPFPKHLKNVPEIAGGHHEKMDGTGYPKRLTRGEMSWPARMMAIADIFEALTAADRPYKRAKPLSEAIRIMSAMRREGHIDPDLFELFLTSGVYREYAELFLAPEQIDRVDVAQYLAPSDYPNRSDSGIMHPLSMQGES
jgi:HD-GYP domain-containing protein (c-di-GMP phosphodiesterase class II)